MKILATAGLLTMVVCSFAVQTRVAQPRTQQSGEDSAGPAAVGMRAPEFCLKDLAGKKVCSDQFLGKVLLIDFWASWCGPCKTEMPAYEKFQERYGAQGLMVIGVGLSMDTPANLTKFAEKLGVHYTLLMGTMKVQDRFELKGIPTTILVDRRGVIRKRVVGFDYPGKFEVPIRKMLN